MTQESPIHHASFTMSAPDTPRRRIRIAEHLRRMALAIEAGAKFHGGLYASGEYSLSGDVVLTEIPETVASASSYLVDHPWVRGLLRAEEVLAYIGDPTVHDSDPGTYEARAKIGLDAVREALMTPVSNASQPAEQPRGEAVASGVVVKDGDIGRFTVWLPTELIGETVYVYRKDVAQPKPEQHPDDVAVDAFAAALKEKLSEARAKGRGGWNNAEPGMQQRLSDLLREHVEKGDPRDVANFAMFLHQRGESILPKPEQAVGDRVVALLRDLRDAFRNYEMDVDDHPTAEHRALMKRLDAAIATPRPAVATPAKVTDDVRVPLHEVWADVDTLIARVEQGTISRAEVVSVIRRKIDNAYAALTAQCQVREDTQGLDDSGRLTPGVSTEVASRVLRAYRAEVGTVGSMDLMPIDTEAMRVALTSALASPSAGAVEVKLDMQRIPAARKFLRAVVDRAWQEATESEQVPAMQWADRIIDQVIGTAPEVTNE